MNAIYIKKTLASLGLAALVATSALVSSCTNRTEELFDKTVNERIDEAATSLRQLLVSSQEGWVLEYIPASAQNYGAYYIGLKFSAKGEVLATTEMLADPTSWIKSEYTIGKDKNLSINFDTYNEAIHMYSTPDRDYAGGRGRGFLGDYEFNIVERVSDNEVRVRGKKTGNYMTLRRATAPIDSFMASILAMKKKAYNVADMAMAKQDALVGNVGGKSQLLKLDANGLNVFSMTTEGEADTRTISYFFTPTGIRLVTPIEGVTEFVWSETNKRYESSAGNLTARIDPTYEAYTKYLGAYTMRVDGGASYDVQFTETGYREYTITGLPFSFKATYNATQDRFEIVTQPIGVNAAGETIYLCMWDVDNGGNLTWGTGVGVYSSLVKDSNPASYALYDNGRWGNYKATSFILWKLKDGSHKGESKDYAVTRFTKPTFTRK